jgi:hypothetical protein
MKLAGVSFVMSALILAVFGSALAQAQSPAPIGENSKWLLGEWKGTQSGGVSTSGVEVEFKDENGQVRWELFVKTTGGLSRAVGAATITGDAVTMDGKYTSGSASGSALTYSLTRTGDALTGSGRGLALSSFSVSWKKLK